MGWIINAGNRSIRTKDAASLVNSWCSKYDLQEYSPEELRDMCGSIDFDPGIVKDAHQNIPQTLEQAKEQQAIPNFLESRIDEPTFLRARDFLRYAAENNHYMTGSY